MNPMGSPRVSAFPNWLKVGSGAGLFFMVAAMVLPRLLRKADQLEAHGTQNDPLPPHETPPHYLFLVPTPTPTKGSALRKVLQRRWKSIHSDELTKEQLAILVAQSAISTNYGNDMISFNPTMSRSSRFYLHPWTIIRVPEWKHHRPMYRWAPIKVYASLDAGVYAWLKALTPDAVAAIRANDPAAYAKAILEMGEGEHAQSIYEPELVGIRNRLLLSPNERVPLPVVSPGSAQPLTL
tara:strand:+ start:98 stop:811 length:714 start_codon:yes stop_codon:yes gene_type:complete